MEECNHNQIPKSKIYNLMSIIMIPTLLIKSTRDAWAKSRGNQVKAPRCLSQCCPLGHA